jgi:crossover junction endodeoxyribonuclease RuvC
VIAIGIDPGTRHLGWGVIRAEGNQLTHVAHGVIDADAALSLARRLEVIDSALTEIIGRYRPEVGSVETLFFHRDPQAAAKLGHARGVVLLGLSRASVEVAEYAPAHMVRALLALEGPPRSDAADALALAITHCRRGPIDLAMQARRSALSPELAALFGRKRGRAGAGLRRIS